MLNASQKAAKDLSVIWCSRMNKRSAYQYTMFTSAQLMQVWHEQWSSNKGDLDSSIMRAVGCLLHGGRPVSDLIFVP
jgi:hypothetical protein